MTRSSRNSFYFRPDKPIQSAERYVLADIEMQDLGLVQPPRLSREERKKNRSPFLEFDTASSECLRILDHRMRHPASNESLINQRRSPILALYELLERNPRGAQFAAKALINELNTFTQATNNFNRELRSAREKVYPLSEATVRSCGYQHLIGVFYEREDGKFYRDHWAPYPIQARPLLELIKAVKILESISKLLGSSNEASLKSLAQKIDLKLANPALKPILRSELISSNTREILNPYLAVRAQEIELKSKEWESEGFSKSYQEAYSLYWSKVSEDSCQTFMRRQEWEWRKAAEDRSELSEKLGAELRSLFETYRELHLLKVNEDVSTKRPGHRTPNNPFLTGLCSTIQGSLIPKLEYYARVALMLANGARFPEIGEPSTQQGARQDIFQIKGFKNTSIREEAPNKGGMDVLFPWFNQVSKPKITAKPVDISIPDSSHTILLTGPSNSGKTVIVQSVGAIKVCTQVGLPIFAESASLKIKGRVFTAFSASYQYQDGLGHLALTLHRLRAIYEQARAGDTVLIDELPAGTNYQELKEITFKIYRSFIERGVTLAASSHNKQPIRRLRDELAANVQKTQMSSDRGTIKFNYNPTPGVAEHSYGIELMSQVGLPPELVNSAKRYYSQITGGDYPLFSDPRGDKIFALSDELREPLLGCALHLYSPNKNYRFNITRMTFKLILAGYRAPQEMELEDLFDDRKRQKLEDIHIEERNSQALLIHGALKALSSCKVRDLQLIRGEIEKLAELIRHVVEDRRFQVTDQVITELNRSVQRLLEKIENIGRYLGDTAYFTEVIEGLRTFKTSAPETLQGLINSEDRTLVGEIEDAIMKVGDYESPRDTGQDSIRLAYKWRAFLTLLVVPLYKLDLALGSTDAIRINELQEPTLLDRPNFFEMSNARPYIPKSGGAPSSSLAQKEPSTFIENGELVSFSLDDANAISIVLGPNNSGKTTFTLNCAGNLNLALNGFFVPASVKVSKNITLRQFLGADSRSSRGQSLFSHTLEKLGAVLQNANSQTLIFLDEMKGSDFVELAAIQLALIDYCRRNKISLVYNTHIKDGMEELKGAEGVSFFATEYDFNPETCQVTSNYRIKPDPELRAESHGMTVARSYFPELFGS